MSSSGPPTTRGPKEDTEVLEQAERRTKELGKGLEHRSDEKWLRELRMLNLEKEMLGEYLITLYNHLNGAHCTQVSILVYWSIGLFWQVESDSTRGNGFKLHHV